MKTVLIFLVFTIFLVANERIVTLAPSINEIVFALGLGNEVVGNTEFCDYPKESQAKQKIGGYASISLEKILKLNPSIVISQNYDRKLIRNLQKLNIKTLVYKTNTVEDIKNTILDLGKYFKKEKSSKKLVKDINKALKSINSILKDKRILFIIGPQKTLQNQIYIAGNHIYFDDIIKLSGNKNAYFSKSSMQAVVNVEKILKLNPEIIILLAPYYEKNQEELQYIKELWLNLPIDASKYGNIFSIHKEYAGIPSHRLVYFIKDFRKILEDVRDKKLQ